MKKFVVLLSLFSASILSAAEWITDLPNALQQARRENKAVLLDFTGSDWCGWCKRLKGEVFDTPQFKAYADANLVLVEVDFPQSKPQSRQLIEANDALAKKYKIQGYPTIVIVDSSERVLGVTGYKQGGPTPYIADLEKITGLKMPAGQIAETPAPENKPAEVPQPAAKPGFPAPAAKIQYGPLTLKAITGPSGRKLALINDKTLATGETAMVKVGDSRVKVLCKEIRDNTVVVSLDEKPDLTELMLNEKKAISSAK